MIPDAAIRPPARALSCPAATIMGTSSAESAAASATAEPDSAERMQAAMIATYPSPPFTWPTAASATLTMRLERPPVFMISPASMKNGTASSGNESAPLIRFCATICASNISR
jgi:hypothetical protein